ncbi:MAG: chemotaxis response regulator protein-glutamate methylesterase [Gammaproteobacteria bacterium]|nr:chemotaxis response regulator protein-glutamate methylesterase [Gammaproteobacteria bacterium]
MKKIKVLIVDDSALVRQMLSKILSTASDIEVVGVAHDPMMARDKIKMLKPDVLTLDVEMPRMDGVTFLGNLMRLRPMPVVMVSSLTEKGADITLEALALGAVDFVSKPKTDLAHTLDDYAEEIIDKVRAASTARVRPLERTRMEAMRPVQRNSADAILEKRDRPKHFKTTDRILAIGASTGGTEAIKEVLIRLPADTPGTVITQHIPAAFSAPFAKRMNGASAMTVCEAQDGQQIVTGHVYIAPGSHHLMVERDGARYVCRLNDGPLVNRHKPSVDVMFRSMAQNVGSNAVGVLLTGMGNDGAAGMKEMQEVGASTIAQDEKSSVVWGMPGEAVKLGGVDEVLSLLRIPRRIEELLEEQKK